MRPLATALPQTQTTEIHWMRIIVAGFMSELAVIALLSAVMVIHRFVIAPGLSDAEYNKFSQDAGYYAAAPAAALATFLTAFWAVRKLGSGLIAHGALVGAVATLLAMGFIFKARPEDRLMYIASFVLRIGAGYFAGYADLKMKERR